VEVMKANNERKEKLKKMSKENRPLIILPKYFILIILIPLSNPLSKADFVF